MSAPANLATAQHGLADIAAALATARRSLAEGDWIDLAGLDEAVDAVCAAVKDLPAEDRPAVAPAMHALADELDGLAADLARQSEAAARRRASAAYGGDGVP